MKIMQWYCMRTLNVDISRMKKKCRKRVPQDYIYKYKDAVHYAKHPVNLQTYLSSCCLKTKTGRSCYALAMATEWPSPLAGEPETAKLVRPEPRFLRDERWPDHGIWDI